MMCQFSRTRPKGIGRLPPSLRTLTLVIQPTVLKGSQGNPSWKGLYGEEEPRSLTSSPSQAPKWWRQVSSHLSEPFILKVNPLASVSTSDATTQSKWELPRGNILNYWPTRLYYSFRHLRLFANPWTIAHQAPLYMEFSRQEHWSE